MNAGQRLRATYEFKPLDHLVRKEFHFWDETIAHWKREGLPEDYQQKNLFHFDPGTRAGNWQYTLKTSGPRTPFTVQFERPSTSVGLS